MYDYEHYRERLRYWYGFSLYLHLPNAQYSDVIKGVEKHVEFYEMQETRE